MRERETNGCPGRRNGTGKGPEGGSAAGSSRNEAEKLEAATGARLARLIDQRKPLKSKGQ